MLVHVYEVTALHVVEVEESLFERSQLEQALGAVKEGITKSTKPGCQFVAIIPGGQETKL